MKLPLLQGNIKRDPQSYYDEFLIQKQQYDAEMNLLQLRPGKDSDRLAELITFISHTVICYKKEINGFYNEIFNLLDTNSTSLHPNLRLKFFQALYHVQVKGGNKKNEKGHGVTSTSNLGGNSAFYGDPFLLIKLSFKLFTNQDKILKEYLTLFIFNYIKSFSKLKNCSELMRSTQAFLHKIITEEENPTISQKAVEILSQLYRKRVYTDARTVNIIASALLSNDLKIMMTAVHFFLDIEQKMEEDDQEEIQEIKQQAEGAISGHEHSKKTKKRQRQINNLKKKRTLSKKMISDLENCDENNIKSLKAKKLLEKTKLFSPILHINNPLNIIEKLFYKLNNKSSGIVVQNKLLIINLISQLITSHKLIYLNFYTYLCKYFTKNEKNLIQYLLYFVQGCHNLLPPNEIYLNIKIICSNLINENSPEELISLGINSIKEICARIPSLLLEEEMEDLIQDLVQYVKIKNKNVVVSVRGLINFIRENHPTLLKRKDRGKDTDIERVPLKYGETRIYTEQDLIKKEEEENDDEVPDLVDLDEDGWEEVEEGDEDEDDEEGDEEEDDEEEGDEDGEDGWEDVDEDDEEEEEEDDEEYDEEGWEDVEEEDDDEEEEEEVANQKQQVKKADEKIRNRLDVSKVISSKDLSFIEKMSKNYTALLRPKKRKQDEVDSDEESEDEDKTIGEYEASASLDLDDIAPQYRNGKSTKIERIKKILEGRTEKKWEHEGHAGGLTNKEKERKKNYVMVRRGKRKVADKMRASNAEQRHKKNIQKEVYGRDKRKRRRI